MIFVTESEKEIQVPSDYTFQSLEKFAKEIYQQGRADAIEELLSKCEQYNYTCNSKEFAKVMREQLKEQSNG